MSNQTGKTLFTIKFGLIYIIDYKHNFSEYKQSVYCKCESSKIEMKNKQTLPNFLKLNLNILLGKS